ncbi:chemotaxis protein CheY [Loktanella sp. 1ANDIMAR09]|uniref:Two-component system, chemotaxis family, response regulator CheY n=1 Tax=Yoonia rosea TaxID=287098 RepID=A0A1R3WVE9_9RHOB|nr:MULTISPECIES: response regulator [Rhodobacterales]KQB95397.1 chemotaxis protein CheY [Loktanella sp. 1ANDIMAR09]KQI71338.1 chemotaxis protein CheY [Loktanella sp. 5RATIMAR09]SIT82340.1 two-component system, chemotaxis family, response regulator CheY [Yoonia rosea]
MSLKDSLRVMIVDDMGVSRGLLVQAIEEMGIWKNQAENDGRAALQKLIADPVHLVLSDYNMPGMDGLQLLQALRQNRSTARIGFILVTGNPTPDLVSKGKALGLNNIIKKPFTTATMKQCIESVVGRL